MIYQLLGGFAMNLFKMRRKLLVFSSWVTIWPHNYIGVVCSVFPASSFFPPTIIEQPFWQFEELLCWHRCHIFHMSETEHHLHFRQADLSHIGTRKVAAALQQLQRGDGWLWTVSVALPLWLFTSCHTLMDVMCWLVFVSGIVLGCCLCKKQWLCSVNVIQKDRKHVSGMMVDFFVIKICGDWTLTIKKKNISMCSISLPKIRICKHAIQC